MDLLVHESTHAWQWQNEDDIQPDYIINSAHAQLVAMVRSGSISKRGGAYDYKTALKNGAAWEDLNPEQQARLVEDYGKATRTAVDTGSRPWEVQKALKTIQELQPHIDQLRRGLGAPRPLDEQ